jgi:hypothetical protein
MNYREWKGNVVASLTKGWDQSWLDLSHPTWIFFHDAKVPENVILGRFWVFKGQIDWKLRFKIFPSLKSLAWTFSLSILFIEHK